MSLHGTFLDSNHKNKESKNKRPFFSMKDGGRRRRGKVRTGK
jgi:hypothetical protein